MTTDFVLGEHIRKLRALRRGLTLAGDSPPCSEPGRLAQGYIRASEVPVKYGARVHRVQARRWWPKSDPKADDQTQTDLDVLTPPRATRE